jgi:hypothetical protein
MAGVIPWPYRQVPRRHDASTCKEEPRALCAASAGAGPCGPLRLPCAKPITTTVPQLCKLSARPPPPPRRPPGPRLLLPHWPCAARPGARLCAHRRCDTPPWRPEPCPDPFCLREPCPLPHTSRVEGVALAPPCQVSSATPAPPTALNWPARQLRRRALHALRRPAAPQRELHSPACASHRAEGLTPEATSCSAATSTGPPAAALPSSPTCSPAAHLLNPSPPLPFAPAARALGRRHGQPGGGSRGVRRG